MKNPIKSIVTIISLSFTMRAMETNELHSSDPEIRLISYATYGTVEELRFLLGTQAVNVNFCSERGIALLCAIKSNSFEVVKFLLDVKDLDPNTTDKDGWTALLYAQVIKQDPKLVRLLLSLQRLDINSRQTRSAFYHAMIRGLEDVKLFLSLRPGLVNARSNLAPEDPPFLTVAASSSEIDIGILKLFLLTSGLDVNMKNEDGTTALMVARREALPLLLSAGINVNAIDNSGNTALIRMAACGRKDAVRFLVIAPHINVNITNHQGNTALMEAARNGYCEIVALLLAIPQIKARVKNYREETALIQAAKANVITSVELLLKHLSSRSHSKEALDQAKKALEVATHEEIRKTLNKYIKSH